MNKSVLIAMFLAVFTGLTMIGLSVVTEATSMNTVEPVEFFEPGVLIKPIVTSQQMNDFSEDYFGTCPGILTNTAGGGFDEFHYFGDRIYEIINNVTEITTYITSSECKINGLSVFQLTVDPNNRWIKRAVCFDYVFDCPVDYTPISLPTSSNPSYNTYLELI